MYTSPCAAFEKTRSALDLPRDYVRHGIRAIAEDLCTRQLGHRNQLDAIDVRTPRNSGTAIYVTGQGDQPGELG